MRECCSTDSTEGVRSYKCLSNAVWLRVMIVSYRIVYRIVSLPWSGLSLSDTARCHVIITIVLLVNIFCRPRGCVLVPTYRIYGGVSHIFMENVAPLDLEGTRGGGAPGRPGYSPPPDLGLRSCSPVKNVVSSRWRSGPGLRRLWGARSTCPDTRPDLDTRPPPRHLYAGGHRSRGGVEWSRGNGRRWRRSWPWRVCRPRNA